MTPDEEKPCSICGAPLYVNARNPKWLRGNNASPINGGRCCDVCDVAVVIPERIRLARKEHAHRD